MENLTWFPRRNPEDGFRAIIRNFVYQVSCRVSRSAIDQAIPLKSSFSLQEISKSLSDWGLKCAILPSIDGLSLSDLPAPAIVFKESTASDRELVIFCGFEKNSENVLFLHTRKGWVLENSEDFAKSIANKNILGLVSIDPAAGEVDFEEKERQYVPLYKAYPGFKNNFAYKSAFLSKSECIHIISLSQGTFKRSGLMPSADDHQEGRTSYTADLMFPADDILKSIKKRVSALIELPEENIEWFQCIRYLPNQEYQNHYDTFDISTEEGLATVLKSGQRLFSILVYLNDDFVGGGTYFPEIDLFITPKQGSAILFRNIDDTTGNLIQEALHAGKPVTKGCKYALNIWVRSKPFI